MKGCPLTCLWCSTPQTQERAFEILHIETHCQACGRCQEICPIDAITFSEEEGVKIDRKQCTYCSDCIEACPNQALEFVGNYMTVEQLYKEVEKDSPFYRRSGGGVTVGGGEPTMQYTFVYQFLKKCKQHYLHTAIETCGFVEWEQLEKLLEHLDLVYIDIKHMDAAVHEELTGVSNELILENTRKVADMRPLIIRIPTVPGYNDSDDDILATARFATELGKYFERIELLPYHRFGSQTYSRLGREYELADVNPPSDDHMKRLKEIIESCGVRAQIGG
jgi:pyruvate formate lyase activating enzyme